MKIIPMMSVCKLLTTTLYDSRKKNLIKGDILYFY